MRTRVRTPVSRPGARRASRERNRRPEVVQFQSWQRWMPQPIASLVRLVRALAH